MDAQTTTLTVSNWTVTVTGNRNMHFVNIEQREGFGVNITWEDGQAKVMPRLLSSMTVEEATDYANQMVEAINAAGEITARVNEHLDNA